MPEFLAALHLVEHNGENEERWENLFQNLQPSSGRACGFLLALHDCCIAKQTEYNLPVSLRLKLVGFGQIGASRNMIIILSPRHAGAALMVSAQVAFL